MNPKIRVILAVIAGIVAGSIIIFIVQMASPHQPPADLDITDKTKFAEWVNSLPMSAFLIVLLSYFLGSVAGGWVANKIAAPTYYRPALVAGFGLFVMGLINLITIPHPMWFAIVSSLLYFLGAWVGGRMVPKSVAA